MARHRKTALGRSRLLTLLLGLALAGGCASHPGVEVPFIGRIPDSAPEVGKDYDRQAHDIAEVRVKLAGKRLADRIRLVMPK